MMNVVVLHGNFVRDPELKVFENNKFLQFDIAVNNSYKKDGEWVNDPTYVTCKAWDSGAEAIANKFSKGDPILLSGKLLTEKWEKDGKNFSKLVVRVNSFDPPKKSNASNERPESESQGSEQEPVSVGQDGGDDDIPF